MTKFPNLKTAITLALALFAFAILNGTVVASAQAPQANSTGAVENSSGASGGNSTMISSMHLVCSPSENNTTAANINTTTSNRNGTSTVVNSPQTSSNSTMAGRSGPINDTATAGSNGANITAIGESVGMARIHLQEGCDAINKGDSQAALMHMNLVARTLDSITGNLTSMTSTVDQNSSAASGGTNTGSVEGAGGQNEGAQGNSESR